MRILYLDKACELLRECGVVRNRSDFCTDWLGQSECYLRTIHCKKSQPSLGVMAICASRMKQAGELMIANPRYHALGQRFLYIAEKCHELVIEDAVELELAA